MSDILILDNDQNESNHSQEPKKDLEPNKTIIEKINDYLLSMQKLKTKDKVIFYRLLATMTNAGMSVLKSVIVLEKQEKNPAIKVMLQKFVEGLRSGQNLSECMEKYPSSFSESEI
jgi:type IV pilus assembly protein PilC